MNDVLSNEPRDDRGVDHFHAETDLMAMNPFGPSATTDAPSPPDEKEVSSSEDSSSSTTRTADEDASDEAKANTHEEPLDSNYEYNDCTDPMYGPVLGGYDVVAYRFLSPGDKGVLGSPDIFAYHRDYLYNFASDDNRLLFLEDPDYYVPAFGGFCSYGVAEETVWSASNMGPQSDPEEQWIIYDDRLFMNRGKVAQLWFRQHPEVYLQDGTSSWHDWWGEDVDIMSGPKNTACFNSDHECNGCDDDGDDDEALVSGNPQPGQPSIDARR